MGFSQVAIFAILFFPAVLLPATEMRSFTELFPSDGMVHLDQIPKNKGITEIHDDSSAPYFIPSTSEGKQIAEKIKGKTRSFLIESLRLIPYEIDKTVDIHSLRSSLSQIQALSGRKYYSSTRNKEIPLFEEATRIESVKKQRALPDPIFGQELPSQETAIIRLKDANFGNSIYEIHIDKSLGGVFFELNNLKPLTYTFIPIIDEKKFFAILYAEPLKEGLFIYGLAGTEISAFFASRVNMPSAVRKRLDVIVDWVTEGVGLQNP